jgi:FeS assembly SUF system protein
MMSEHDNETGKIQVEEVDSVPPPPKARVDMAAEPERRPDYLEGFLSQKPAAVPSDEPGGDVYEGVIDALKEIFDPEIPVNIYELGLIYGVDITQDNHVVVTMTLTTPHCPVAESMPGEVELRVGAVPGVGSAEVNLVWDPPWDPQKMSDEAKLELGML